MFQTTRSILTPLLLCLFLLLPSNASAAPYSQNSSDEIINKASKMVLWEKTEWLNLLHYNKEFNGYASQVDDDRFFYAADGRENPQAELIETIKHLFTKTDNDNEQTQCQFVARTEWLSKQLNINKKLNIWNGEN